MEISQKDFSELTNLMSSMTKALKNFDDRLTEVENNVEDLGETVTVDLPKVVAEQVGAAVDSAVAESTPVDAPVAEDEAAVADAEVSTEEGAEPEVEAEVVEACGDGDENFSFEEFAEKATKTVEDLTFKVNDLYDRMYEFIKGAKNFAEEGQEPTSDIEDVAKVETALKEDPATPVTEEEPQITKKEVVVEKVITPAPVVTPAVEPEAPAQFSEKRYQQVKNIFNL